MKMRDAMEMEYYVQKYLEKIKKVAQGGTKWHGLAHLFLLQYSHTEKQKER